MWYILRKSIGPIPFLIYHVTEEKIGKTVKPDYNTRGTLCCDITEGGVPPWV